MVRAGLSEWDLAFSVSELHFDAARCVGECGFRIIHVST